MKIDKVKHKILIVGLPRSGTTIITNYINSMDNAFCFIEPYWEYKRTKKTNFFNDNKLKNIWWLRYKKNDILPLDNAINKILKKYDIVGLKETFRSNIFQKIASEVTNENLLQKHKKENYKIIGIVRNPVDVWNSMRKNSKPDKNSWAGNIELFIQNYCNFFDFIKPSKPIIYEKFVSSPKKALGETNIPITNITNIKHRNSTMGDRKANSSTVIKFQKKNISYTGEEKEIIENSEAMKKYKKILNSHQK